MLGRQLRGIIKKKKKKRITRLRVVLNVYKLLGKGELPESVVGPVLYSVCSNSLAEARVCTTIKFTESKLSDWWKHSSIVLQVRGT